MPIARTLLTSVFPSARLRLAHPARTARTAAPLTRLGQYPRQPYSTMSKTLAVLDAAELQDGKMKAVEFDGGKVLLSKINGEVHATSAHCTHYGAPLEKGVLSADGRVVCPWHGACFDVCTGDIEDAPGLDSLYKYKAEIKDGKIFVTAPESEIKSKVGRVIPKARKPVAATEKETVVIVGGGSGGIHTIESLREHNFAGDIVLISHEPYAPIDRTKLSKGLVDDPAKIEWRKPAELENDFGVKLHLATNVKSVDTAGQSVTLESGDKISYDQLVLSPGATPRRLPIPGADLEGVITIRTTDDIKKITSALGPEAHVIIIGTSFIGLEAAGALAKKEHKSLTVVGVDEVPFEKMLSRELGEAIVANFESQGVKFHRGVQVEKIAGEGGKATALHVKGMDPLPATIVIMGTGVAPATSFLKESGSFKLEKDGGITVDDCLRVPGAKNVYAIGDIAHYPQFPDGHSRRVEHWNVAGNHGRHVAQTITGNPAPYRRVPVFWSSVGKGLRYVGTGAQFTQSYLDGSAKELKFVLYQADDSGKITTVASMGRDPYVSKASELLRLGKMPTLDKIKAGANILEIEC